MGQLDPLYEATFTYKSSAKLQSAT